MWLMLQAPVPDDYVIATGETHSVREFCELAFAEVDLPLRWEGTGVDEVGIGPDGQNLIRIDPRYFRPAEVDLLLGDASKAQRELGWRPKVGFKELVNRMVVHDLYEARERSPLPVTDSGANGHRSNGFTTAKEVVVSGM